MADAGERREGPDRVTLVAFGRMRGVLIPLVAIVLAWWLQDERITWAFAAGSVLVLMGVYLGALRRPVEEQVPEAVRVPSER